MLQPFIPFNSVYLNRLPGINQRYLVSQRYRRVEDLFASEKTGILVSAYEDLGAANIHLNAIKHDSFAAVLDLQSPTHKQKMEEMLQEDSKYKVFWAIFKSAAELKKHIDIHYAKNMERYIKLNTNWRIGRNVTLEPSIQVTFGELFIVLKYGGQTLRVKFEEIERS